MALASARRLAMVFSKVVSSLIGACSVQLASRSCANTQHARRLPLCSTRFATAIPLSCIISPRYSGVSIRISRVFAACTAAPSPPLSRRNMRPSMALASTHWSAKSSSHAASRPTVHATISPTPPDASLPARMSGTMAVMTPALTSCPQMSRSIDFDAFFTTSTAGSLALPTPLRMTHTMAAHHLRSLQTTMFSGNAKRFDTTATRFTCTSSFSVFKFLSRESTTLLSFMMRRAQPGKELRLWRACALARRSFEREREERLCWMWVMKPLSIIAYDTVWSYASCPSVVAAFSRHSSR
mmetsp:Transcript_27037/g.64194  ORF Transcript_27037/g.64194 Transcript_27037/m.64194 type:complete len:297 (-) Transcript_27037:828-1718(-)